MELLNTQRQDIKKVSYTVKHDDKEYILIDYFEGGKVIDTILRDKDGNNIEEPGLFEEISNYLDTEAWWSSVTILSLVMQMPCLLFTLGIKDTDSFLLMNWQDCIRLLLSQKKQIASTIIIKYQSF